MPLIVIDGIEVNQIFELNNQFFRPRGIAGQARIQNKGRYGR